MSLRRTSEASTTVSIVALCILFNENVTCLQIIWCHVESLGASSILVRLSSSMFQSKLRKTNIDELLGFVGLTFFLLHASKQFHIPINVNIFANKSFPGGLLWLNLELDGKQVRLLVTLSLPRFRFRPSPSHLNFCTFEAFTWLSSCNCFERYERKHLDMTHKPVLLTC